MNKNGKKYLENIKIQELKSLGPAILEILLLLFHFISSTSTPNQQTLHLSVLSTTNPSQIIHDFSILQENQKQVLRQE